MYFRQPAYFGDFRCIGGNCQFTCCQDWRIDMSTEEVEKMKNAPNCSKEMLDIMDKAFVKSNAEGVDYNVKFDKNHKCPLLTEDGYCRVQRELGAEYLSNICMSYPRVNRMALNINTESYTHVYRYCNLSCIEVSKRLITNKKAMSLINLPITKDNSVAKICMDREENCEERPELLFRTDMFEFFYALISDNRYSVETAIINGAIAAGILDDIVKEKQYAAIPQALEEMREGFLKGNLFRELDSIKPDYNIKVGFVGGVITKSILVNTLSLIRTPDGKLDLSRYFKGEKKLLETMGDNDFWLRNVALNLLLELNIPIYLPQYTILESYSLYMMILACIKLNAIASMSVDTEGVRLMITDSYYAQFAGNDRIWGFTSLICRELCQSEEQADKLIQALKDAKLITPGQLALLIK